MIDITVRPNDELPVITATLTDSAGQPVNLTGATVTFQIRGATRVFAQASFPAVQAGGTGGVQFTWGEGVAGLPTVAGLYFAHWRVTYADAANETFPNASNGEVLQLITG